MSYVSLDPQVEKPGKVYQWMVGAIVPRPIAFVSTVSPEGVGNLAPFSFFNGVSSSPPCLVFSVTRKRDGGKKDTLLNIERQGDFVVNIVDRKLAAPMNQCAAEYPYGVDEMTKVGLHPLASIAIKPSRVVESPLHIECVKEKLVEIGGDSPGSAVLVVGRIVRIHVRSELLVEGEIDATRLDPVARLGGPYYTELGKLFALPRPTFDPSG